MKRVTKKSINNNFPVVIEAGYCDLQHLLKYRDAIGYTAGTLGWDADIYAINAGVAIVTGYRPFGNVKPSYDLIHAVDEKARRLTEGCTDYDYCKKICNKVIGQFVVEAGREWRKSK